MRTGRRSTSPSRVSSCSAPEASCSSGVFAKPCWACSRSAWREGESCKLNGYFQSSMQSRAINPHQRARGAARLCGRRHPRPARLARGTARQKSNATSSDGRRARHCSCSVGDLVDRGPNSAQVIERLRTYRPIERPDRYSSSAIMKRCMLRILDGDASIIASWLQALAAPSASRVTVIIERGGHRRRWAR